MHTFKKENKLINKKNIEELFLKGNNFTEFPIQTHWRKLNNDNSNIKLAISITKKRFPKAVNRNLLKRYIRESFRTNNMRLKNHLSKKKNKIHILFIFIDNKEYDFKTINNKIIVILERLIKLT